jgi:hypothetical protein
VYPGVFELSWTSPLASSFFSVAFNGTIFKSDWRTFYNSPLLKLSSCHDLLLISVFADLLFLLAFYFFPQSHHMNIWHVTLQRIATQCPFQNHLHGSRSWSNFSSFYCKAAQS